MFLTFLIFIFIYSIHIKVSFYPFPLFFSLFNTYFPLGNPQVPGPHVLLPFKLQYRAVWGGGGGMVKKRKKKPQEKIMEGVLECWRGYGGMYSVEVGVLIIISFSFILSEFLCTFSFEGLCFLYS